MYIRVDLKSDVPIYRQIKTQIIRSVLTGELSEGDTLPAVRQLACDLGVNMHTVRKVYTMLKDEGYIAIYRNQKAVVTRPPEMQKHDLYDFAKALLPLVIEMRSRNITKAEFDEFMDTLWEQSMKGGTIDERQ